MSLRAQTPIAFVQAIVAAYVDAGRDPRLALHAAGITYAALDDPKARVTAGQLEAISHLAMRELDDEALGWFERPMPWGTRGMLCRASLPSPDLRVALSRWCRHHALIVPDIKIDVELQGTTACIVIDEWADLGQYREFCLVSTLRHIHGLLCWLADTKIGLQSAAFPFDAPPHAPVYGLMFCRDVEFAARRASIRFDARCLGLPVVRSDGDLRELLERPLPLMVLQYRQDRSIAHQVRSLLRGTGADRPTAESIASRLNISVRSLHRHLAGEGTSLRALKGDLSRQVALEHLARGSKPIKQVASSAGYRSKAGFNRAFRHWTGQTPMAFQARASGVGR